MNGESEKKNLSHPGPVSELISKASCEAGALDARIAKVMTEDVLALKG